MATSQQNVMRTFGDFIAESTRSPLSDEVVHHARRVLIDYMAALLAGARMEPATSLAEALAEEVGQGAASLPGRNLRALPRVAALINGTASHIVEFDDIFRDGIYHPGCPTIAAAIAACEAGGLDGQTLIRAIVAGYEVSTRIAAAIQPNHYRFWHTTGTVGTFGAAAAVAAATGLSSSATQHALGTAGTFAAGLQQAFRSDAMSKPLHAGRAAEGGYLAAVAAARGVTGALDILEGDAGFGRAMSGDVDWSRATESLGDVYNVTRMTVKNHGCCGHTFAAIDGALELQEVNGFKASDIERIGVGTYGTALKVTGSKVSSTPFEGKFSLPYVVSHALVFGSVRLNAFDPDRLANPEIRRLIDAFDVYVDEEAEASFPTKRAALVTIRLRDGREFSFRQPTRKGDPDAPLSDDDLNHKFQELAGPVLGDKAAQHLLARLWRLDSTSTVDFFM